ncbi:methionine ABC transporter permease [Tessaracoccus oleiagri]|uniref:D-methionine transport system permease protein n=1 Tax=Tessaracoccus oleiagri TaxID=686624 RepID=A0A1G9N2X6_9ACTN|nr:methionine ABC transporter permease [Tessaracoccus oleiagri]SDL80850.1 D-methionine transport system permease protein [Tessaracoccus oleiagri]
MDAITPQMWGAIWDGLLETLQMVGISGVFTVLFGLPLGIALFTFNSLGFTGRVVNTVLGVLVNITRSFPYAILMVSLIPLTKILVGTSIGPIAASVSLTIAAVPFFARLVETALRDVHSGKTDAAFAMGSSRMQVIRKVWLPEAMPTLIAAVTTTIVTIVGYSAMAGLIGGGGLGRLAYNYGYQRFIPEVMVVTIVILIILVQLIQLVGDRLSRVVDHR